MVFLAEQTIPVPQTDLISWIFDEVPYDQDKPIYIDAANPERTISANQARIIVRKLVAGLRKWGVRPGQKDVVCLHAFNDILYPMLFLGIIGAGGIFAGTNPSYTSFEIAHHMQTSETKFVITEPEMLESVLAASKECNMAESNILILDVLGQAVPESFRSWETLLGHGEQDWVRFSYLETAKTTEAARLFSSGTTGPPKAAMISHHNLIAQHTIMWENDKRDYPLKRLLVMPMFHVGVLPVALCTSLKACHVGVVMRRFDLAKFLSNIEKFQINELALVPPIVIATVMAPITKGHNLKSVKSAMIGAAPLDKGPQLRFQALIGDNAPCTQVYGMTEATCIVTRIQWPEKDTTGSVGRPAPNIDMKIVDDNNMDITNYNVCGEICVRGPTVIPGYLNNPVGNQAFDSEGFYHTGDIGYCDADSKLWYIVDRKKELIKVRAWQVAPPELEAVLLSHPQIVDAAVIGVQFSRDESQLPRAYVVRRPGPDGNRLNEEEVKIFMDGRLAKYKRLDGGVKFVDAIPKNASGKILKRLLRDEAKREIGAKL